jgi:tetratricopeptide (TPR) repeat protein
LRALDRPAEALVEYEQSLSKAPNRFNSLYGAARSAELSGRTHKAREYYSKLIEIVEKSTRPEVEQARAFLDST